MDDTPLLIDENILPENVCIICHRYMPTRGIRNSQEYDGLKEVHIKISHARCDKLMERRNRIIEQLRHINRILLGI